MGSRLSFLEMVSKVEGVGRTEHLPSILAALVNMQPDTSRRTAVVYAQHMIARAIAKDLRCELLDSRLLEVDIDLRDFHIDGRARTLHADSHGERSDLFCRATAPSRILRQRKVPDMLPGEIREAFDFPFSRENAAQNSRLKRFVKSCRDYIGNNITSNGRDHLAVAVQPYHDALTLPTCIRMVEDLLGIEVTYERVFWPELKTRLTKAMNQRGVFPDVGYATADLVRDKEYTAMPSPQTEHAASSKIVQIANFREKLYHMEVKGTQSTLRAIRFRGDESDGVYALNFVGYYALERGSEIYTEGWSGGWRSCFPLELPDDYDTRQRVYEMEQHFLLCLAEGVLPGLMIVPTLQGYAWLIESGYCGFPQSDSTLGAQSPVEVTNVSQGGPRDSHKLCVFAKSMYRADETARAKDTKRNSAVRFIEELKHHTKEVQDKICDDNLGGAREQMAAMRSVAALGNPSGEELYFRLPDETILRLLSSYYGSESSFRAEWQENLSMRRNEQEHSKIEDKSRRDA